MKKWYHSAAFKGLLIVAEYIFIIISALCIGWILLLWQGDTRMDVVLEKPGSKYQDSSTFKTDFLNFSGFVTDAAFRSDKLKTEGKLNEEKLVDIKELVEKGTISGENNSGVSYRLGDLLAWNDHINLQTEDKDMIRVCQREDGSFHYYTQEEFGAYLQSGEFRMYEDDPLGTSKIYDSEDNLIYERSWDYDGYYVYQYCPPKGYNRLIDLVNTDSRYNGELSTLMSDLEYSVHTLEQDYQQYVQLEQEWDEGDTNAVFLIKNMKTNKIYTNREVLNKDIDSGLKWIRKQEKYAIITPKRVNFESNMGISAERWEKQIKQFVPNMNDYVFAYAIDTEFPIQDNFYGRAEQYNQWQPIMRKTFVLGTVMGVLALLGFVILTMIAGRSNAKDGISLFWFDRVCTEIFIAVMLAAGSTAVYYALTFYHFHWEIGVTTTVTQACLVIIMAAAGIATIAMVFWLGMVRRIKAGTVWSNSILRFLTDTVKMSLEHVSALKKVVSIFVLLIILHWLGFVLDVVFIQICILCVDVILCVFMIRSAINIQKLKKGVISIANGKMDYQIPTGGLSGEQLEIAQSINQIGDGLDKALQESMKNERMKTDLITNVSHDIKTPLTSIINYIGLLKMENFDDPKVQGYLDVLDEKSQRLKILTEDVVEASKLSSGNVKLEMINLNLGELVQQACAELEDKFAERNLHLVLNIPEEPVVIYADGRRMWRVLSNLLVNAAKYALAGTRVYVDIKTQGQRSYFIIKNISEQELNISPDELTERFIRGDDSRTTQGSGLGLSIARSLTELQGGTMNLHLDGDLFKVELCFTKTEE